MICLGFPELPLKGNYDETKFKLYYPDTGLLVSTLDDEAQEDLRVNKNLGVYKGALYENMVAEALYKQNFGLFYYMNDNSDAGSGFLCKDAGFFDSGRSKSRSKQGCIAANIDSERPLQGCIVWNQVRRL